MSDPADRRRSPRTPCDLPVDYGPKGTRTQEGRITNIGTGGVLLTTQGVTPPVGSEVLLRFHLPLTNRPVQVLGNVRWTTQGTAGVEFVYLHLQEQDEIWRYYARQLARQRDQYGWTRFERRWE